MFKISCENGCQTPVLSRRCGLDPMELLEEEDFMHITDYNRLLVLTFLGNTVSQLSESILIDIGKTVHKISLEEARKEVENSNERNYNPIFDSQKRNKVVQSLSIKALSHFFALLRIIVFFSYLLFDV